MIRNAISWAKAWAQSLVDAQLAAPPHNAAMWPPHRNHPTPARKRRGPPAFELVGAKGLRP